MRKLSILFFAAMFGMILSDAVNYYSCKNNGTMYLAFYGKVSCELIDEEDIKLLE